MKENKEWDWLHGGQLARQLNGGIMPPNGFLSIGPCGRPKTTFSPASSVLAGASFLQNVCSSEFENCSKCPANPKNHSL
jgi:ATP-dependent 26S proteasome regulatory subunit